MRTEYEITVFAQANKPDTSMCEKIRAVVKPYRFAPSDQRTSEIGYVEVDFTDDQIADWLSRGGEICCVSNQEGELLCFSIYWPNPDVLPADITEDMATNPLITCYGRFAFDFYTIASQAFSRLVRGRAVKAVYEKVCERCVACGADVIMADALVFPQLNMPALQLFTSLGFLPTRYTYTEGDQAVGHGNNSDESELQIFRVFYRKLRGGSCKRF